MSKNLTLFVVALLLLATVTHAARPEPAAPKKIQLQGVAEEQTNREVEGCHGIGEDECLLRRTLVAHTDYIYTQGKKN